MSRFDFHVSPHFRPFAVDNAALTRLLGSSGVISLKSQKNCVCGPGRLTEEPWRLPFSLAQSGGISENNRLNMAINIPGIPDPIDGDGPIVILGANGSGKTRLAVQMANSGSSEFIPALRNIAIPDQIPNWTLQTATNELQNRTNQRRNSYWELVPDIDALFGKLWSSHAVEAMRVYDQVLQGSPPEELPETVLTKTKELWHIVFPGRTITFNDFTAK